MNAIIKKISDIRLNDKNPRTIDKTKMDKLVKSIKEFPEMLRFRPIVIDSDNVVLGGNMRLQAAKKAGLKEIPALCASQLTDEQKKEFIIKDNVGFGEWDYDILKADWNCEKLMDWGLDLPDFKIENKIIDDEDIETEGIETKIVLGDLIEIGEHRLLCADSTSITNIDTLLNNSESPDFVFSDPMYNDDVRDIVAIFETIKTNHFLIMCTFKQAVDICNVFSGKLRFDLVFDQKIPSSMLNKGVPYYLHKNVIYITKTDETIFNCDNAKGFFSDKGYYPSIIDAPKQTNDRHGLSKNVNALRNMLSGFDFKIVLDQFIGGGSTMIAAQLLKRKCYGIEINPTYCQIIIDRMIKNFPELKVKINGEMYDKKAM
jgi:16S rRNA G966 N2-methylase RsmD